MGTRYRCYDQVRADLRRIVHTYFQTVFQPGPYNPDRTVHNLAQGFLHKSRDRRYYGSYDCPGDPFA